MDRRQQKTRTAIFDAFSELLSEEPYSRITIQTIIDRANIGRSTFYSHFQTKDDLLNAMCTELFRHIIDGVMNHDLPADHHNAPGVPDPVFCHILQHIKSNSYHIKDLLISESSDIFLKYFRDSLRSLISIYHRQFCGNGPMVGKESYAADAGGIGFLFPFRYLSCHMKIKSHVYLLGVGQQDKESHQISNLPDTLMMTDYKGRVIKMSSDMSNEKTQEPA